MSHVQYALLQRFTVSNQTRETSFKSVVFLRCVCPRWASHYPYRAYSSCFYRLHGRPGERSTSVDDGIEAPAGEQNEITYITCAGTGKPRRAPPVLYAEFCIASLRVVTQCLRLKLLQHVVAI